MTKQNLIDQLVEYAANNISTVDVGRELTWDQEIEKSVLLGQFQKDWENAPCDEEGATKEQDENMDRILDEYANELFRLFV